MIKLASLLAPKVLIPVGLGIAAASGFAGYKVRGWQCEAAQLEAIEEGGEREREAQDDVGEIASGYEDQREEERRAAMDGAAQVRVIYRTVPPPPVDCEPPSGARSLLSEATARANASASGEPRGELSSARRSSEPTPRP